MPWWVPFAEHVIDAFTVIAGAYFAARAGRHARRARRLVDSMYPPDFPPPTAVDRLRITPRER